MMRAIVPLVFLFLAFMAFVIWRIEAWATKRARAKVEEAEARERYAEKLIAGTASALPPPGLSESEILAEIRKVVRRQLEEVGERDEEIMAAIAWDHIDRYRKIHRPR